MFQASHKLPVYRHRHRILRLLKKHQVIVVESPTGSGKTTQLPIILHKAHYTKKGVIGVTQPRRIAATSVARYVKQQIHKQSSQYVAHKIRFEDATGPETRIKIMTDGTLLQEIKNDPLLTAYSTIIIDEAHERSITIDFILGLLKRLLPLRPDIKIIVSSATMNTQTFSDYFFQCPIVSIPAKMFPVKQKFLNVATSTNEELVQAVVTNIKKCLQEKTQGDILVFLPGEQSIKSCINSLNTSQYRRRLQILPLYSRMSSEEQEMVFLPAEENKVKVVLATNIAETSITIDGIVYVIDSGLAKINHYDGRKRTSALLTTGISRSSAAQRMGRAGRTRPGICIHLFSEKEYRARPLYTLEEIHRTDLSEIVLRMADLGIKDFERFDFAASPEKTGILSAVSHLQRIQALDTERAVTSIGRLMLEFPLIPSHAKIIVTSMIHYPEVLHPTLIVVSFLTSQSPFLLPIGKEQAARIAHAQFADASGDFTSWIDLFHRFQKTRDKSLFCQKSFLDVKIMHEIVNVYLQLKDICEEHHISVNIGKRSYYKLMLCVMQGLIDNVCKMDKKRNYQSIAAEGIYIHPGSTLFGKHPAYIVSGDIIRTSRMYARSVAVIRKEWIMEMDKSLITRLEKRNRKPLESPSKKKRNSHTHYKKIRDRKKNPHPNIRET